MSFVVVKNAALEKDVVDAVNFYKKIDPKLAKQFLFRLREAKICISKAPLGFQIKYKNVRTLLLRQFPYQIHYVVDDTRNQIVILAVIHAYKNPLDYTERL